MKINRWPLLALLALLALAAVLYAPVTAQEAPAPEKAAPEAPELTEGQKANLAVLDSVIGTIRARFFDRNYCGIDLTELRTRHAPAVTAAKPGAELHRALRTMLAEFKVSHLTVVAKDVFDVNFAPEMTNEKSQRPGLDITESEPGKFFVSAVLDGSGAQHAGVLRGDRLVEINGVPTAQSPLMADSGGDPGLPGLPHYFVRVPEAGQPLILKLQRRAQDTELLTLEVPCTDTSMIEATRNSVSVIEHQGRKFGYIHFWHFLHAESANILRTALQTEWADCDGVIVDLRGRGGNVQVMNACFYPFGTPPPARARGGRTIQQTFNIPKWTRPVVALQDSGSRSAKEVYAHNWKWQKVGPVVGEATPGAVLGSTFAELPDGSRLLYPAQNVSNVTWGSVNLEGNPVEPTHAVKDLLEFAAGGDTIKEAGIKVLFELVKHLPKAEAPPVPASPRIVEEFSIEPIQWRKAG